MQNLPPTIEPDSANSQKLAGLLESILKKIEQGESIDIEALKAAHPEIAPQLEQCIHNLQFIEGAAELLESSAPAESDEQASRHTLPFRELGDFRILRQLGRGGMGVVYEAEQLSLRRTVALKILPLATLIDQRAMRRFKNEVAAVASLDHPHIVDVYTVACDRGVYHYAMRLIRGSSAAQILEQMRGQNDESRWTTGDTSLRGSSNTSPNQGLLITPKAKALTAKARSASYFDAVAGFGASIAEALDYAHEHGVIHRDVKPANLMIDEDGKAWITDFGLAQIETGTQLTMTGDLVGTALYMSPEQLTGKRIGVDHRTDIYSLGVTLYEMLTLTPPFKSEERQELVRQIMLDEPKTLRNHNAFIPEDLETIVLKAIEKSADQRYVTAQELADDLRRFRQHEPIRARRATIVQKAMKWTMRHQALTWAVMLTLLCISIVSMVAGAMVVTTNSRLTTTNSQLVVQTNLASLREVKALAAEADARSAQIAVAKEKTATEGQRDIAMSNLYLAHMRQAQQDWNNGQVNRLQELLEGYIPEPGQRDLRRWEWYFFLSLCYQDLQTFSGHIRGAFCVAWSPDGTLLASGSADGTIKIWDVANAKELRTLEGHVQGVPSLDWSPDGKRLVSGSSNGDVKIWAADTGEELAMPKKLAPMVNRVAWSPNGQFVCWGERSQPAKFTIWDVELASLHSQATIDDEGHTGGVGAIAWSPDRRQLALGAGGKLTIWDFETQKEVHSWKAHEYDLWALAWSPSGDRLVSAAYDRSVKIWQSNTWEQLFNLSHQSGIQTVDWSPDGNKLVVGTLGQEVKIWDSRQGVELATFRGHSDSVFSVAWSPVGEKIASGSGDRTVKIWDATSTGNSSVTSSPPSGLPMGDGVREFSPDGKYIIALDRNSMNRRISIHESTSPDKVVLETGIANSGVVSWNRSASRIAIPFGKTIGIWDISSGQQVRSLEGHAYDVWGVCWSPDGERLASSAYDGTVKIWDPSTGKKLKTLFGHDTRHYVSAVTWSPDGERIAAGGWDRTVRVWNTSSGSEILVLRGHSGAVWNLDWSPHGSRIASREQDGQTIKLWDASTGQEILTLTSRGEGKLKWSADGRQLDSGTTSFDASRGYELFSGSTYANAAAWRYFDRAGELALSGRFTDAKDSYQKSLKFNPLLERSEGGLKDFETDMRLQFGFLLSRNGEFEGASDAFRETVALNPKHSVAYNNLGRALIESASWDAAIEAFGKAIEIEPEFGGHYSGLGVAQGRIGQYQAAIEAFGKAIELSNRSARYHYEFAWLLATCPDRQFQNPEKAVELAVKATELAPRLADAWSTLGASQYRAGHYSMAVDALEKSIELNNNGTSFSYYFLAMAYWQLGDHERARDDYAKAESWMQRHKPDDPELQRFRAEASTLLGKDLVQRDSP